MKSLWALLVLLFLTVGSSSEGRNEVRHLREEDQTPGTTTEIPQRRFIRVKRAVCGGDLRSSSGVIASPNHPGNYAPNTNCTWNIIGSETERIVLDFKSFNLEHSSANCAYDHVLAYTAKDSEITRRYGPFCGTTVPGRIISGENILFINFKTDGSGERSGFSANYWKEPCGGVFRVAKGNITSPEYPAKYPRYKRCIYEIVAPSGQCVSLKFTHFNLESNSVCGYDSVQINCTTRRGTVYQYGRVCGSTLPANINCEGSKLRLEFKSDISNEYSGFLAEYSMNVCGGDLHSSSGVITSPNYPGDYPANTNCTWNIIGSPTERIVVEFKQFNLEYSSANCHYDHVLAYTEKGSEINRRYGPFCGTTVPGRVVSEENTLFLNFKTDHSDQRSGFSANYWKEPCGGVFTATKGNITSPEYPELYPRNKRCIYEIVAPSRHCINLRFTHFSLQTGNNCGYDSVQINSTTHRDTVHQYRRACGTTPPNNITCEGKKLRLEFVSDGSSEYTGFVAEYDMVLAECANNNAGCKHVCKSNAQGKHTCACHAGYVLHPDDHDCKEENSVERLVHFTSLLETNGTLIISWRWRDDSIPSNLSGYYFKATSQEHKFQTTLPRVSTNFSADQLRAYKEYDISLWPFYGSKGSSGEKLGKPMTLSIHTPASAPTAPTAVTPWPESAWLGPAEVILTVYKPLWWNSKPAGYRFRIQLSDGSDQNERTIVFPEVSANQERSNYDLNITLSLKPGRTYTVFVSACGLGDIGETLVGPETATSFGTIPLAPVNLRAEITDPTTAMLAWESASPATRHDITVSLQDSQGDNTEATILTSTFHPKVSSSMVLWTRGRNSSTATIWLDGSSLTASNYSLPVFGLTPYKKYEVEIQSCVASLCSETASADFKTLPLGIPTAIITKIFSNDTSSINLEWSFPRPEKWIDLGLQFEVRAYNNGFFRLVKTTDLALRITNLIPGAQYQVEIRPSLEVAQGMRKYANPATAVVSTWSLAPLPPTLATTGFETAAGVIAVSWVFFNSTVERVEVATNSSDFANCETLPACDIVVRNGWNASFKAGFVKISGLTPNEVYFVDLRGCNDHGCGDPTRLHVTTGLSVPSEPLDLQLVSEGNQTALLTWSPPLEPGGPITGYLISWECLNGSTTAATTTKTFLIIPGPVTHLQECSFSVAAYHVSDGGEELRGKPATLTAQFPLEGPGRPLQLRHPPDSIVQ